MNFLTLPIEILKGIFEPLSNRDLKSLRLTCRSCAKLANLRIHRVFISANPLDVEVFDCIASDDRYREQVKEIVWDDARFEMRERDSSEDAYDYEYGDDDEEIDEDIDCPGWFVRACRENKSSVRQYDVWRLGGSPPTRATENPLPYEECWRLFQQIYDQQREVIESQRDIEAFSRGLTAFPSLRRITISPIVHRDWPFLQYQSPTIRSFPPGFNYPLPDGWPTSHEAPAEPGPWDDNERFVYRGFCSVISALASSQHNVVELIIDVNHAETGLNAYIFDTPRDGSKVPEYDSLSNLLQRPEFIRLDLALNVIHMEHDNQRQYQNGRLKGCLAAAHDLEHFSLSTNARYSPGLGEWVVPLERIFPVLAWPKLKHFGLFRFIVETEDLIKFLQSLPKCLESIELSHLEFADQGGNYKNLLTRMSETLSWVSWKQPPKITICLPGPLNLYDHSYRVQREVDAFVYAGQSNPFEEGNLLCPDVGTSGFHFAKVE